MILFIGNTAVADDFLQGRVSSLLPPNARWAMVAVDMQTGREVASAGNALDDVLVPASLTKLFTTGAVLDITNRQGGLDLKTAILTDGTIRDGTLKGNLYLAGRGNGLLTAKDLEQAAWTLRGKGVIKITGDIVADGSFLDTRGLERSRRGAGHAPAGALGLDLHTVALTVYPTEPGKPPRVEVEPENDAVRLAVEARTTAGSETSVNATQLDDFAYRIKGDIPSVSPPMKWRFPLADPALYTGGVVRTLLKRESIDVRGEVKRGKSPTRAETLVEIPGPPLSTLLGEMNRHSLNVVADNLLLAMGAAGYGPPGTREKGLKAVREFLGTLDLPMDEVQVADGSGLSGENRTTARFMASYLARVGAKPWFGEFHGSLPRSGMEGTAARIGFRNDSFRVKTGTLEDVFSIAGYGVDGKGREIAFAYIVNVPGGGLMGLERSGAEVMRLLSEM